MSFTSFLTGRPRRNCCAYIAGDHRIFFPALVALTSIEEHNPGRFDKFVCFNACDLTDDMARRLKQHGIRFIDAASVSGYATVMTMSRMQEGKWPVEVFLNWALPAHLLSIGYLYSVKLDYDTLAIAPFPPLKKYLNNEVMISAIKTAGSTEVSESARSRIIAETGISPDHPHSINVGVVFFNNRLASDFGFFEKLRAVYQILIQECPELKVLEQVAFAIVAHSTEVGRYRVLPKQLNWRVKSLWGKQTGFTSDIVIAHYITPLKPWKPIEMADVIRLTKANRPIMVFFRTVWLEYAQRVDGFDEYCDQRPFTAIESLALANMVLQQMRKQSDAYAVSGHLDQLIE